MNSSNSQKEENSVRIPEDPREKRIALLKARMPRFNMFMNPSKLAEAYTLFLMQELDQMRGQFKSELDGLALRIDANKLGLNEPLPSVDGFIAEIESIIEKKTNEAEQKAYLAKWLSKFGPENVDKLYNLGVHVFESLEKKAIESARAQTIKAVSIVGVAGIILAGATLIGAHYVTRYNSTTQIQKEQRLELEEYKKTLRDYKTQLVTQQKTIEDLGQSLTNHAECVGRLFGENRTEFASALAQSKKNLEILLNSKLDGIYSNLTQVSSNMTNYVDAIASTLGDKIDMNRNEVLGLLCLNEDEAEEKLGNLGKDLRGEIRENRDEAFWDVYSLREDLEGGIKRLDLSLGSISNRLERKSLLPVYSVQLPASDYTNRIKLRLQSGNN